MIRDSKSSNNCIERPNTCKPHQKIIDNGHGCAACPPYEIADVGNQLKTCKPVEVKDACVSVQYLTVEGSCANCKPGHIRDGDRPYKCRPYPCHDDFKEFVNAAGDCERCPDYHIANLDDRTQCKVGMVEKCSKTQKLTAYGNC